MKKTANTGLYLLFIIILASASLLAQASESMTNKRLDTLIKKLDPKAKGSLGYWQMQVEKRLVLVITDEKADRMRIFTHVASAGKLNRKLLFRMMQANFDAALDARYAVAQGKLWSAFIHPLSPLSKDEFFSGVAQVVTLATTYGSSYSSGALIFRGGDTQELHRKLYERILRRGRSA